jgi:hypothetical protein
MTDTQTAATNVVIGAGSGMGEAVAAMESASVGVV